MTSEGIDGICIGKVSQRLASLVSGEEAKKVAQEKHRIAEE